MRKIKRVHKPIIKILSTIGSTFLALGFSIAAVAGEPLPLTDAQLDSVNAGYVVLSIDATAEAHNLNPVAITLTDTNVLVGEPQDDGFVYTVAEGYGFAYASGETVYSSVSVSLDTDEVLVSSDVFYLESSDSRRLAASEHRAGHHHTDNYHRRGVYRHNGNARRDGHHAATQTQHVNQELILVRVHYVTRQPVSASSP